MASVIPDLPVQARDQAFETLYRRYVRDVYYYALAMLRNPADAEDVTQTTFMNAYRAYKRGDEIRKPQNWLIKIAHNVARTRYARASRRVKEVPLEDHVDRLAVPEEDKPSVEGVLRALGRLPFNQRAAIVMRELEGRSYAEIADTLGVSVSAVETLIFRARRSLRVRSSTIRVLTAVPLPNSLAQLFQGGAVVAGGGAIAGAGFLGKAMVLLIAGVMATGVAGDKTDPATAAARNAVTSQYAGGGLTGGSIPNGFLAQLAAATGKRGVEVTTATGTTLPSAIAPGDAREGTSPASAVAVLSSVPSAAAAQLVAAVSKVVSSAENAVTAPALTLPVQTPSLPVEPPSLPIPTVTLTVPPPSLPVPLVSVPIQPPSLPVEPPSLTVEPPSVPVEPPSLPAPPPLPKLP
jgi:RNA polymerase sigma factor (sigma-70 family)